MRSRPHLWLRTNSWSRSKKHSSLWGFFSFFSSEDISMCDLEERERESQARGEILNVSFYMTYWGKAGAGFSSINYGSLPVSVADNRPPTIHLRVSSLRHFPYMHMYNDVLSYGGGGEGGEEDGGRRMKSGATDNYFLKLSSQSLNTHLRLPVKAGEAEDKGLERHTRLLREENGDGRI